MPSRDSIDKVAAKSARAVRGYLKTLGIEVPDVDGPDAEAGLHSLQQMQAIEGALKVHTEKQGSNARATFGDTPGTVGYSTADTMDSGSSPASSTSTGAKGSK